MGTKANTMKTESEHLRGKISVAPTSKARKRVSQRSRYPDNYSKNSRKAAKKTKKQQANLYDTAKRRNFAADI